ncbi:hypothetical protein BpHYR1_034342 [Brachionus plicatilis]|uniref:Uncharacterized protein n=1 Tax=Brachionus plicatilis TaxID=10195 RepID=A0A3M7P7P2_BRAPC|nr:hypothetical protein BpHYR1_034342 [Brachionus plicatilis]
MTLLKPRNIELMDDTLDDTIQSHFAQLDIFFNNFDQTCIQLKNEKTTHFDDLKKIVNQKIAKAELDIRKVLNKIRHYLLFMIHQHLLNACLPTGSHKNFFLDNFVPSHLRLDEAGIILGNLKYKNNFYLLKKFNYFDFLNQCTHQIQLNEELIRFFNVRILILSQNRFFVYLRTNDGATYFKIYSNKCQEVYSIKVDSNLVYRNVLSHNSKIVCLFNDPLKNENILSIYKDNLVLLESIYLDYNLILCSLLENEIICWHASDNKCLIFDFGLNLMSKIGQIKLENEPFYFENGILIESSKSLFLIYYFDKQELKHFIKILDRSNGRLTGVINFDFNYFSKMIRIDNLSNILVKLYEPANEVKYYDSCGNLLKVFVNNDLAKYNRIDLSQEDDLICYDKVENKILFF